MNARKALQARLWGLLLAISPLLAGCANLTVTHVSDTNKSTVQGIRYYLPKPYLQVTPKADGTVSVNLIYLPDTSHEYAVDTTSWVSSYTFQIARDPLGLLSGVEYKADTTAVAQQVAASAQAAAVQAYNLQSGELAAVQSQVNTAQAAVDSANSALVAAQAALASDSANLSPGASQLATDNSNVQQAMAKLTAAQQVLARTQNASQAIASNTISAATPVTTTGPTMGSPLSAPSLTPTLYNLPTKFGAVLFAVNEDGSSVSLKAVTSAMAGSVPGLTSELHSEVNPAAQPTFETVGTGLGPPSLAPTTQTVKLSSQQTTTYTFSRAIVSLTSNGIQAQTDATPPVPATIPSTPSPLQKDEVTLKLDISHLTAGNYVIAVPFLWAVDTDPAHNIQGSATVKLTVGN